MKNIKFYIAGFLGILVFLSPNQSFAQLQFSEITGSAVGATAEDKIGAIFGSTSDMIAIAKCESGIRQFRGDGSVLRGPGGVVGIFQLHEASHKDKALKMGMDIYTEDGNIAYAKYLYDRQGTVPWTGCITTTSTQAVALATTPAPGTGLPALTANLSSGMLNPEVLILQKQLNALGYKIADSGPGSPGQETTRFGALTKAAVQRFQCAKGIACSGSETTNGYGRVGPKTRATLNSL